MVRILIVDDHSVVRVGLRAFLERDREMEIVDEAADGVEAIEKARMLRPDVVLMDLLLPQMDGVTATAIIRRELPETEVVALSSVQSRESVVAAIRAGAIGYLLKDTQVGELFTAIKAAAAGHSHLSPLITHYLLNEIRTPEHPIPLTEREMDVLHLLAEGHSNKAIATSLRLSEDTVKSHVRHILNKLCVQSRTQAILEAMRIGLIANERMHC